MKKTYLPLFLLLCITSYTITVRVFASQTIGTIDPTNTGQYIAAFTHTPSVDGSQNINFGKFSSEPNDNITVTDDGITGYAWGSEAGWIVMNCENTTSGCTSLNQHFKVAVDANGTLSGYAWGQKTGWVYFGPFTSNTPQVQINQYGQFAGVNNTKGYAWSANYGWIIFDCSQNTTCVTTDYIPQVYRNTTPTSTPPLGGHGGGPILAQPPTAPTPPTITTAPSTPTLPTTSATHTTTPTSSTTSTTKPQSNTPPSVIPSTPKNTESQSNPIEKSSNSSGAPHTTTSTPIAETPSRILSPTVTAPATLPITITPQRHTNTIAARTIATLGIVSGVAVTTLTALFATPLSLPDVSSIPLRIWVLSLEAFGIKKRNRPWGTVYDSVTKQPIDPAYVVLQDMEGNEVMTSITDLDGRYGFLIPTAGSYRIIANKTNYRFPSEKLSGRSSDEIYEELYTGGILTITNETVITKNIPLDPIAFDWNEFAKKDQHLMKFYSRRNLWITRIAKILFGVGFITSIITAIELPSRNNYALVVLYIVLYLVTRIIIKPRPFGTITEKATGAPLSYAIVRIFLVATNREVVHKVADEHGVYYCLVPNGTYYATIEKKNTDQTYSKVYTSEPIVVTNGYIHSPFTI